MAELFNFREAADAAWSRPKPVVIELSWSEVLLAAQAGVMRRVNAVKYKRRGSFGGDPEKSRIWGGDIDGCIAELAVAKYYNVFWSGTIGRVDLPDVGPYQVRSKMVPGYHLIVRDWDGDDEAYISVLVEIPRCTICGWMYGGEAKQPRWRRAPDDGRPPGFFVPEKVLRPIKELAHPQSIR